MASQIPSVSESTSRTSAPAFVPERKPLPSAVATIASNGAQQCAWKEFNGSQIEDSDLEEMAQRGFTHVSFNRCTLSSVTRLPQIDIVQEFNATMRSLHHLLSNLQGLRIERTHLPFYKGGLPISQTLQTLDLDTIACSMSAMDEWAYLAQFPNLKELHLTNCTINSDLKFPQVPQLRHLHLSECKFGNPRDLLDQLSNLKTLHLENCTGLNEEHMSYLRTRHIIVRMSYPTVPGQAKSQEKPTVNEVD